MIPVDVVWEPLRPGERNRGWWDQAIVERLLAGRWTPPGWPGFVDHDDLSTVPDGRGAVIVLPARHHTSLADLRRLNGLLSRLPWVLLILTGDEEGAFDTSAVRHPRMRVWVQTPHPGRTYPPGTRWLPNGPSPHAYEAKWGERTRDVVFAGQVTHSRRADCAAAVQACLDAGRTGALEATGGFTQGLPPDEYAALMASAKVCPAPSGPVHVDSFRAWEAMELGCLPVLDAITPDGQAWGAYWRGVLGPHALPVVDDWTGLADVLETVDWSAAGTGAAVAWQALQRGLAYALLDDITHLSGQPLPARSVDDQVTVLIPTSPIAAHPDTSILRETVASVRTQLPHAEILVMCDGVRPEQAHYRERYEAYLYEVARLCREEWTNVLPVIFGEHAHQAGMTSATLDLVSTPLILFVEHDCPIGGDIDWPSLTTAVTSGRAGIIRLHHEASILDVHRHLMLGRSRDVEGAPLTPTIQFSARPHLASAALYGRMLRTHFAPGERAMIEDRLHGVVQDHYAVEGKPGWERWHLYVYTPTPTEHGIRRSWHLDGRGDDPKWELS